MNELIAAYGRRGLSDYLEDGELTSEPNGLRQARRFIRARSGHALVGELGPLQSKAVRQAMFDERLSRSHLTRQFDHIKRMFAWAFSEEMIPMEVCQPWRIVDGLRRGRTSARKSKPAPPVSDEMVSRTLPTLPPVVAVDGEVQRRSGMRPH